MATLVGAGAARDDVSTDRLVHHELCFGCGRTNLFGLLMEVDQVGEGQLRGRGFIKQDHQGPVPGAAHPGIVAAALTEVMAFAAGDEFEAAEVELQLYKPVSVGSFLTVEANAGGRTPSRVEVSAIALLDDRPVASAHGAYRLR